MVNGYNDNIYLTELWGLTDLIYVKYLGHDWHMINEKSLQSFPKGKGFCSLTLPKAQAVMPRKLFRNLLTAHLWYQVCFSVKASLSHPLSMIFLWSQEKSLPFNLLTIKQSSLPAIWETRVRSLGLEGNGNPLQYSWLENFMDRGIWWATVHGIAKSQAWLSD